MYFAVEFSLVLCDAFRCGSVRFGSNQMETVRLGSVNFVLFVFCSLFLLPPAVTRLPFSHHTLRCCLLVLGGSARVDINSHTNTDTVRILLS